MRFGVALDLWAKEDLHSEDHGETAAKAGAVQPAPAPSSDPADVKEAELFALIDELAEITGNDELGANTRKQCAANREAWADDRSHYLDWVGKQITTVRKSLEDKRPEGESLFAEQAAKAQAKKAAA